MNKGRGAKEQERAVQEVLVQMFAILLCTGKSEEEVRAYANSCIEVAVLESQLSALTTDGTDAQEFGSVLRTWHRQVEFLSKDGFPRPLRAGGANGLRSLIARYFPAAQVDQVFSALQTARLIRKVRNDRWLPTRKHAVLPHLGSEALGHLSEGVSRLVETVIGNVTAEQKDGVLFERSAKVRRFPVSAAAEFREFIKTQAVSFLGAVDDWMEAKAEFAKRRKGRKCSAGVFTFAFMDAVGSRASKATKTAFPRLSARSSR